MTLAAGDSLQHYRLIEKLGEGGMGVVWKAVDTTLDREVAIKVLPQAFADHPERLARFEREAKLLASLNHPHIAGVYGFHEADTAAGKIRFIAMELVGGEDLSQRLARGPMTPARALAVASQIAEGLSAAHEAGVIHRDLKPANIKMTADGKVKVLDFGLAKALEPGAASGDVDLTSSPTMTSAGTMAGMILGTAAYMSPEQARGRPVDRRTDLWAFGAVLFEMLGGRPPFPGEVISEIIAKILEREPDWEALPEPLHPGVRRLLQRCLAKDPERRLRDAADAKLEIDELLSDPTGERMAPAAATPAAKPATSRIWTRAVPLIAVALLVWAIASMMRDPVAPPARRVHFEINPPTGHQFAEFATAPDGSAVAFVAVSRDAGRSLWVRRLDSTAHRRLAGTEGAWFPFWSPDARSVGFFSRGKLRTIDVASETSQTLADAPNGRGGAWGHDGTILFTPEGADVLYAVPGAGGTPRPATLLQEGEATHRFPHFVGETRRFTYSAHDSGSILTRRYLASLDSDRVARLPDGMSETYAPPGYALFVREETLYAQPLDPKQGELSGSPTPLASDIDDTFPRTGRSAFSVSNDGVLMYLARRNARSRIDAFDRDGRRIETVAPGGDYENLELSGDRRLLLFTRTSAAESSLWLMDLARGSSSRLLLLPHPSIDAAWTAADRGFVYAVESGVYRMPVAGGQAETLLDLTSGDFRGKLSAVAEPDVSADGRFVVFAAWDPVSDFDLWVSPLPGDAGKLTPRPLTQAPSVQQGPAFSPDSGWIAYESNESGQYEIYVVPVDDDSARPVLVSSGGGARPTWSDDGDELYYIASDYGVMAVSIEGDGSGRLRAGIPVRLFDGPLSVEGDADIFFRQPTLVSAGRGRFLFQVADEEVRDRTIEVVLGWEASLE